MRLNKFAMLAGVAALALTLAPKMTFAEGVDVKFTPEAEIDFYTGAKRQTMYDNSDLNDVKKYNDTDLDMVLISTSYIGGSFEVGDKLTGTFHVGFQGGTQGGSDERKVMIREAFLEYDLGFGTFLVGNQTAPYLRWSYESSEAWGNDGMGAIQDGYFHPQMKLTVNPVEGLSVYVAAMNPYVPYSDYDKDGNPTTDDGLYDVETTSQIAGSPAAYEGITSSNIDSVIPKIAIGADYEIEGFNAGLGFAANSYEYDNKDIKELHGKRVDSWIAYGHAGVDVSGLIFNVNGAYGQNPGNFGSYLMLDSVDGNAPCAKLMYKDDKISVKNVKYYEAFAEIGYNYDMFTFMIGGGLAQAKNYDTANDTYFSANKARSYYVNCWIAVNDNLNVVPEFGVHDFMKDDTGEEEQGKDTYIGIQLYCNI